MKIIDKSIKIAYTIFPTLYANRKHSQSWHFTFLYQKNRLISVGKNSYEVDGRVLYLANKFKIHHIKKYPSLHSEFDAISRAWGRYYIDSSTKLVNLRLNVRGELQNSKPCASCTELITAIGINKIWYSIDGNIVKWSEH